MIQLQGRKIDIYGFNAFQEIISPALKPRRIVGALKNKNLFLFNYEGKPIFYKARNLDNPEQLLEELRKEFTYYSEILILSGSFFSEINEVLHKVLPGTDREVHTRFISAIKEGKFQGIYSYPDPHPLSVGLKEAEEFFASGKAAFIVVLDGEDILFNLLVSCNKEELCLDILPKNFCPRPDKNEMMTAVYEYVKKEDASWLVIQSVSFEKVINHGNSDIIKAAAECGSAAIEGMSYSKAFGIIATVFTNYLDSQSKMMIYKDMYK